MRTSTKAGLAALTGLLLLGLAVLSHDRCLTAWFRYGMRSRQCPDGEPRQTGWLNAYGLRRGQPGQVSLGANAHYVTEGREYDQTAPLEVKEARLSLVDPQGKETPLEAEKPGWQGDVSRSGQIKLPQVPDGDYRLKATVRTALGEATAEAALPIYAPAQIHVITDRPLYQPGDLVKFRAVALRARDLHPLAGRPGRWVVTDPQGEVLLEEKAPAGSWGVVAGTFPLDREAATGEWRIAWQSGDARDEVRVRVEPFTLPRFRLEVSASQPFYRAHQKPELKGKVVYSSGAPVAEAALDLHWSNSGAWPPPRDWMDKALPQRGTTDKDGNFTLSLPTVPADLQGQVTLSASIGATDKAGDRVEGGASVLLSEDPIAVSTVTELSDGLVDGFNNRLFLRVTTADGQVVPGTDLTVKRSWDPTDKGVPAHTDEDGVAALQLDPGPPVNVVIPPMPLRPTPLPPAVSRNELAEVLAGRDATLAELAAADKWEPTLAACARFTDGSASEEVLLRVDPSGAVRGVGHSPSALGGCVAQALSGAHLPPGDERLLRAGWAFSSVGVPRLSVDLEGPLGQPDSLDNQLNELAHDARKCLPAHVGSGILSRLLMWSTKAGSKDVALSWVRDPQGEGVPQAATECVAARFTKLSLTNPAPADQLGFARLSVQAAQHDEEERPQATTMLGYELTVAAAGHGETRLRMSPGTVPPIRLRATPTLAKAGQPVEVELIRGPNFSGELPEEAYLNGDELSLKAKVDKESRKARFELPATARGWLEINALGVRALVFVRPESELTVQLTTDKERYAPGQTAKLAVLTRAGGKGTPAAVGLFGVDESLGQLATLPGPDDMARVRPKVQTPNPAFGALDGQALTMGRIRGGNAAQATVLRVAGRPMLAELDIPTNASANGSFDPVAELTDHFYEVLAELHTQAGAWEEKAPANEKMRPATMASLWQKALDACAARKLPITDAYGRRLRLSQLPSDLLALTDPRAVVVQGTRLPEDVENWAAWVAKEKP